MCLMQSSHAAAHKPQSRSSINPFGAAGSCTVTPPPPLPHHADSPLRDVGCDECHPTLSEQPAAEEEGGRRFWMDK